MKYEFVREKMWEAIKEIERKLNRKIIYAFLQGSQNYYLDYDQSDIDIKAFVLPNFDDLYYGLKTSKTFDYAHGQITVHDIRMLPELWQKMNPTYIEGFHSLCTVKECDRKNEDLFNDLATTYRSVLLKSILGTFRLKLHEMHHPSEIRIPVIEKYGYDVKSASHALRLAYLFKAINNPAFLDNPYHVYQKALRLEGEERDFIFSIKLGKIKEDVLTPLFEDFAKEMETVVFALPKEKIAAPCSLKELESAIRNRIAREFNEPASR